VHITSDKEQRLFKNFALTFTLLFSYGTEPD
jgi:hypothetical protein